MKQKDAVTWSQIFHVWLPAGIQIKTLFPAIKDLDIWGLTRDRNDACVTSIQPTHAWPCVIPVDNFLFHSDRVGNAWKIQK